MRDVPTPPPTRRRFRPLRAVGFVLLSVVGVGAAVAVAEAVVPQPYLSCRFVAWRLDTAAASAPPDGPPLLGMTAEMWLTGYARLFRESPTRWPCIRLSVGLL